MADRSIEISLVLLILVITLVLLMLAVLVKRRKDELAQANKMLGMTQEEMSNLDIKIGTKSEELQDLDSKVVMKTEELKNLNSNVGMKLEELSNLESKVGMKIEEMHNLENKVGMKIKELSDLETKMRIQNKELQILEIKMSMKVKEVTNLESNVHMKNAELKNLESTVGIANEQLNKKTEDLRQLEIMIGMKHDATSEAAAAEAKGLWKKVGNTVKGAQGLKAKALSHKSEQQRRTDVQDGSKQNEHEDLMRFEQTEEEQAQPMPISICPAKPNLDVNGAPVKHMLYKMTPRAVVSPWQLTNAAPNNEMYSSIMRRS